MTSRWLLWVIDLIGVLRVHLLLLLVLTVVISWGAVHRTSFNEASDVTVDLAQSFIDLMFISADHGHMIYLLLHHHDLADTIVVRLIVFFLIYVHLASLCILDELFENWHLCSFLSDDHDCNLIVRVARYSLLWQQLNNLRVGDPLVVLRIDSFKESFDFLIYVLIVGEKTSFCHSMHVVQELFEL